MCNSYPPLADLRQNFLGEVWRIRPLLQQLQDELPPMDYAVRLLNDPRLTTLVSQYVHDVFVMLDNAP